MYGSELSSTCGGLATAAAAGGWLIQHALWKNPCGSKFSAPDNCQNYDPYNIVPFLVTLVLVPIPDSQDSAAGALGLRVGDTEEPGSSLLSKYIPALGR